MLTERFFASSGDDFRLERVLDVIFRNLVAPSFYTCGDFQIKMHGLCLWGHFGTKLVWRISCNFPYKNEIIRVVHGMLVPSFFLWLLHNSLRKHRIACINDDMLSNFSNSHIRSLRWWSCLHHLRLPLSWDRLSSLMRCVAETFAASSLLNALACLLLLRLFHWNWCSQMIWCSNACVISCLRTIRKKLEGVNIK